jgi:hypothetical protein
MKVFGFTFVRNAIQYDYPIEECIHSLIPICDRVVVSLGKSDDGTENIIQNMYDPKLTVMDSVWDDSLREGGKVLAVETDKVLDTVPAEYDWVVYLQGDEVLHEKDYPAIRAAMEKYLHQPEIEGLLFHYHHFYGSYDYIGASRKWYRREIRIIRNNKNIRSWKDAQGFRWKEGNRYRKLRVALINAHIYHYGWVKSPDVQRHKQMNFNKLWHADDKAHIFASEIAHFDYDDKMPLTAFQGTHPKIMTRRIKAVRWAFNTDPSLIQWPLWDRITHWLEKTAGWRPWEYQNYKLIKKRD